MSNQTIADQATGDQADEEILTCSVADEALEAAAGANHRHSISHSIGPAGGDWCCSGG
jgi:hypothetical protein